MRTFLFVTAMLFNSIACADGEPVDWVRAESGIAVNGSMAYSGCVPADSNNRRSHQIALLKAQANMSRASYVVIAGRERLFAAPSPNEVYSAVVEESTDGYIPHSSKVVKEDLVRIDHTLNLCLLLAAE